MDTSKFVTGNNRSIVAPSRPSNTQVLIDKRDEQLNKFNERITTLETLNHSIINNIQIMSDKLDLFVGHIDEKLDNAHKQQIPKIDTTSLSVNKQQIKVKKIT